MLSKFFLCLSFVVYGIALNQAGNITPHSNARCSSRHLGMGLGGQNFRSNLTEKIVKFANPSPVRAPQRGMVYFSCIALCENTLKQSRSNTQPSRAVRSLGESLYWSPLNQPGNITPHSNARCSIRHLGMGLGGQNFRSNLTEMIVKFANPSPVRAPQRGMVYFSCAALCENTLKQNRSNTQPSRALRRLGGSLYWSPLNQPGNITPHSYAQCSIRHLGVGLGGQNFCFNLREVFFPISFGLMGTIYFGLILLRRMRGYTKTRGKHRRRLGSGYWTRRKIYWRRRKISRTAYIADALQCSTNQRIYSLP